MELKTRLTEDMRAAMRARDEQRRTTLRLVLSAIKLAEVEKRQELDESALLGLVQKEIKSRQETIADAERAGRADLIASAQAEIAILEEYLPKAFTPEELEALARQAVEEVGASSVREMGQVMKILIPRLEGRATGSQASQAVRKLLA